MIGVASDGSGRVVGVASGGDSNYFNTLRLNY